MRVLITGLCGFIAHHVAEHLLHNTDWEIIGLDRIDATSTPHRLRFIPGWEELGKRVKFVWHDLRAPLNSSVDRQIGPVDVLIHMAASTHVDRSITEPLMFVQDNVIGTANLLNWWRKRASHPFMLHFSTDEVFGPAEGDYFFKEWDRYKSTSPYGASKAGAEELVCAFSNTYKFKANIVRVMNVIGERQHPEKFVPMTIGKLLRGEEILIHANKDCSAIGTRYYLHAANVAKALHWLVNRREELPFFDKWNLSGEREVSNLEMAQLLAKYTDTALRYRLVDSDQLRPGHDLRYAIDGTKLRDAGFSYPLNFEQSLERIVKWTLEHPEWL
ncbi:MAG: dTDP-glucose 4,6-dehydratase [Polyangiaceae bacterium]